ncbi:hypothetical protein [Staphylococcus simulans]|nr:hypothetical protein [Staphylococcus simulans]
MDYLAVAFVANRFDFVHVAVVVVAVGCNSAVVIVVAAAAGYLCFVDY